MRRAERKNRDEFRKLMEEHVAAGDLTAKTHWRTYCMKVLLSTGFPGLSVGMLSTIDVIHFNLVLY